jgi:histidinol-phosphate/aromatic aminotransferase/cobyric acid decarboxylase-like protein
MNTAPSTAARALDGALIGEGLTVRSFPVHGPIDNYPRFTVRSTEANQRLIESLERNLT